MAIGGSQATGQGHFLVMVKGCMASDTPSGTPGHGIWVPGHGCMAPWTHGHGHARTGGAPVRAAMHQCGIPTLSHDMPALCTHTLYIHTLYKAGIEDLLGTIEGRPGTLPGINPYYISDPRMVSGLALHNII